MFFNATYHDGITDLSWGIPALCVYTGCFQNRGADRITNEMIPHVKIIGKYKTKFFHTGLTT